MILYYMLVQFVYFARDRCCLLDGSCEAGRQADRLNIGFLIFLTLLAKLLDSIFAHIYVLLIQYILGHF